MDKFDQQKTRNIENQTNNTYTKGKHTYCITYNNRTPRFEWYVVWRGSKNDHLKKHTFEKAWIVCSKYNRLNNQHNWEGREGFYTTIQWAHKFSFWEWIRCAYEPWKLRGKLLDLDLDLLSTSYSSNLRRFKWAQRKGGKKEKRKKR